MGARKREVGDCWDRLGDHRVLREHLGCVLRPPGTQRSGDHPRCGAEKGLQGESLGAGTRIESGERGYVPVLGEEPRGCRAEGDTRGRALWVQSRGSQSEDRSQGTGRLWQMKERREGKTLPLTVSRNEVETGVKGLR